MMTKRDQFVTDTVIVPSAPFVAIASMFAVVLPNVFAQTQMVDVCSP